MGVPKPQLGDRVRDSITGLKGIMVARTFWLYGCVRVTIQPEGLTKDGKPHDAYTIDEPQTEVVTEEGVAAEAGDGEAPPSGPRADPGRATDPL